jgi:hypothetical protein
MYTLELNTDRWSEAPVIGSTAACGPGEPPTGEQVRQLILEHLRQNGFDVASLE